MEAKHRSSTTFAARPDDLIMKLVGHFYAFRRQGMAKDAKVHGPAEHQSAIDIPQHGTERIMSWTTSVWMLVRHRISSIAGWVWGRCTPPLIDEPTRFQMSGQEVWPIIHAFR